MSLPSSGEIALSDVRSHFASKGDPWMSVNETNVSLASASAGLYFDGSSWSTSPDNTTAPYAMSELYGATAPSS